MTILIHMDIDAFFASAATIIYPELKGKPVGISNGKNRSILSSVSYEARKYNVTAGMPVYRAKEYCPDIQFVQPSFELYFGLANKIFKILSQNKKIKLEIASIDECFLDVSEIISTWDQAVKICKKWQNDIYSKLKLNVSFGISFNKFSAKMATNLKKPIGISLITKDNFQEKFWPLDISKFYGIGKRTTIKLNNINIKTIRDLAIKKYDDNELKSILGKNSNSYIDLANGISGNTSLQIHSQDPKSISKSETFMKGPTDNSIKIKEKIQSFSKLIATRLQNRNLVSFNISLNISYGSNLKTRVKQTNQKKIKIPVSTYEEIFKHAIDIFDKEWNYQAIMLIGVGANALVNKYDVIIQQSIYDNYDKKESDIKEILNKINSKFKAEVVTSGIKYFHSEAKKVNKEKNRSDNSSSFSLKTIV